MSNKRTNPYKELEASARRTVYKLLYRPKQEMWLWPKDKLSDGWDLSALYERVLAADQLGHDIIVTAKDDGLHVVYRQRFPIDDLPWRLKP